MLFEGGHMIDDFVRLSLGVTIMHGSRHWQLQKSRKSETQYDIVLQESKEEDIRLSEFFFIQSPTDPNCIVIASVVYSGMYVANGERTKVKKYKTIYFGRDNNTYGMTQSFLENGVPLKVLALKPNENGVKLVALQVHHVKFLEKIKF